MNSKAKAILRSRYPLAILAGVLLACAFPKIGVAGFGWIAPGLLLAITLGQSGKRSFRLGYVAGLAHYLTSLYWLLLIPVKGFPILGWSALAAFIALYPATWAWLAAKIFNPKSVAPAVEDGTLRRASIFEALATRSWGQRTLGALACAALWVTLEMIIARLFGGFPWNLLGASQYRILPLIQIASVTGVYGISFLLVWTSVSLLNALLAILRRPEMRSIWLGEIAMPMLALAAVFAFGFHQLGHAPTPTRFLKVAMVQPSIPQTMIWNEGAEMERFQQLMALSEQALTNHADLLLWPEAAIPGMLRYDAAIREPILNFARSHKVWMIVGSDDAEQRRGSTNPKNVEYYNSSFLISPEGQIIERYKKRSLVIFGEYIPLERWLPFIKWFTPVTGSFTPGDRAVPFEMTVIRPEASAPESTSETLRVKTAVLICFEDNFPHLVRHYVEDDTDFLVNLTNNGWFGEGAAQWQHAANAIFRTIENGLPLVRCTNNGLTCWVDAQGRIREIFRDSAGTIYGAGFMRAEIPLLNPGERRAPTFYNQHGDRFGWACVGVTGLLLLRQWPKRRS